MTHEHSRQNGISSLQNEKTQRTKHICSAQYQLCSVSGAE